MLIVDNYVLFRDQHSMICLGLFHCLRVAPVGLMICVSGDVPSSDGDWQFVLGLLCCMGCGATLDYTIVTDTPAYIGLYYY